MPQISILILGSQLGMKLKWNAWVFCADWKILGSVMEVLGHVQLKVGRVGPQCPREGPGSERKGGPLCHWSQSHPTQSPHNQCQVATGDAIRIAQLTDVTWDHESLSFISKRMIYTLCT